MLPRLRIYSIALLLWGSLLPATQAADQQPLTIDVINQTWKTRRERLQAMHVELSLKQTTSKLLFMSEEEETPVGQPVTHVLLTTAETERLRKEYVTDHLKVSILLDPPLVYHRCQGVHTVPGLKQKKYSDNTYKSNGKTLTSQRKSQEFESISLSKPAEPSKYLLNGMQQYPLRWILLAGNNNLGETLEGFTTQPQTEQVQGLECTVLKRSDSEGTAYLWVAPASHDCVVLKYEYQYSGKTISACDFQYSSNKALGPVPKTCELKCFYTKFDLLRNSYHFTFDSFKANCTIPSGKFEAEFPKGARVTDFRKKDSQGEALSYIVE